jgi:glycosyltransferase involved in cell wall biosynthesis
MKKVLMIVLNDFINEARVAKEADTLGGNGYEVTVYALHSIGLAEEEQYDNFTLKRLKLKTRDKLSRTNRYAQLIKYLEFYKRCIDAAKILQPEFVHIHDIAPLPIGMRLKKILDCRLIYDSHELWSNVNGRADNPLILNGLRDIYEKSVVRKTDRVITVSNSIADQLYKICNLRRKVDVVKNVPYYREVGQRHEYFRECFNIKTEEKILLYQGIIAKGRGVEELIQAAHFLDSKNKIVILGDGELKQNLQRQVLEQDLEGTVFFHDAVSYKDLLDFTTSADLGISLIQKVSLSDYYSLPNKLFEYMQAELPIICSNFPDMHKLVIEYGIGESTDPKDPEELAKKANYLLAKKVKYEIYRENCILAKRELCWETEGERLLELYRELI